MEFLDNIIKYYGAAKLTSLLAQDNISKKWYNIYSVVELIPNDDPEYNITNEEWYQNKIIRSKITSATDIYSYYLYYNKFPSIQDALDFFYNPLPNKKIEDTIINYFNTSFIKEPTSQYPLVMPSNIHDTDGLGSVIPKRHCGQYVWTQIDAERKVQSRFASNEITTDIKAMNGLTEKWLGFEIWSQPENIGNIILVAPNPYFRDFNITLSQNPSGIFYKFKLRKNIKEKFKARIIDKHGDNIALDKVFEIKNYIGLIELPHEPHLTEVRIYNSHNDLIAFHKPAAFVKSFHFNMSLKQADFHVKVQDKDGNQKEFVTEKYSKEIPSVIGNSNNFNAAYYFKEAQNSRKHVLHTKNTEFIFFPGGKSEKEKTDYKTDAKKVIVDIIDRANESCYLCDPYFNVNDLIEFAFRIKNSSVKLRIINSKEFIDKTKAKDLLDAIDEYNKKPFQKIECRLLRGDSILHDRFVISDINVWFLGSSFSEFGKRATCIAKVPDSSNIQIVKEIERWYFNNEYTQSLEEYANNV